MSTPFKMNGISFKEGQIPAKKLNLKGSMAKMDLEAIESVATSLMDVDKGSGPNLEKVDVNTENDNDSGGKGKKVLSNVLGGINAFMKGFRSTQGSKENIVGVGNKKS